MQKAVHVRTVEMWADGMRVKNANVKGVLRTYSKNFLVPACTKLGQFSRLLSFFLSKNTWPHFVYIVS